MKPICFLWHYLKGYVQKTSKYSLTSYLWQWICVGSVALAKKQQINWKLFEVSTHNNGKCIWKAFVSILLSGIKYLLALAKVTELLVWRGNAATQMSVSASFFLFSGSIFLLNLQLSSPSVFPGPTSQVAWCLHCSSCDPPSQWDCSQTTHSLEKADTVAKE